MKYIFRNESQPRCIRKFDKVSMSYHTVDWFQNVLNKECLLDINKLSLDISEWQIKTDDKQLFNIDGTQYNKIHIILGHEGVHWIFYHNDTKDKNDIRRLEGNAVLPISYCKCCLNSQYIKILTAIQNINNNGLKVN